MGMDGWIIKSVEHVKHIVSEVLPTVNGLESRSHIQISFYYKNA